MSHHCLNWCVRLLDTALVGIMYLLITGLTIWRRELSLSKISSRVLTMKTMICLTAIWTFTVCRRINGRFRCRASMPLPLHWKLGRHNNTMVVSYINGLEATCSRPLLKLFHSVLLCCYSLSEPPMFWATWTCVQTFPAGGILCERVETAPTGGGTNMEVDLCVPGILAVLCSF